MSVVTMEHVSKGFAERVVLHDVSARIAAGDRVGLVGANGCGKSTLLHILDGRLVCDDGRVHVATDITIGHLPQAFEPLGDWTVADWLASATRELLEMQAQLTALAEAMANLTGDELEQALRAYGELAARFEQRGGYDLPQREQAVLQGLEIANIERDRQLASLSGGERVRFGLAALLIQSPDLLLLDEPTNHLDASALTWLERFLTTYAGALVVVSHDRWFLNGVVNRILEIDEFDHQVHPFTGDYDAYVTQKNLARQQWEARYAEEQEQIRLLRRRIQEAGRVGHHRPPRDNNKMAYDAHGGRVERTVSRNVQSAEMELDRLLADAVQRPPTPLRFSANFRSTRAQSEVALSVADLGVDLDGHRTLLEGVRFSLERGGRMLITGPNGAGKTTLLDIIAGIRTPERGTVMRPARSTIGYLRQDLVLGDAEATVLSAFREGLPGTEPEHVAQLLSYQLFRYEEFQLKCGQLSPGQHRKLMIAKLMASGANLLLLDEPTNHISFSILEEFERAIAEFPGAVIAVSHDRRFREQFTGDVWTLSAGALILSDDNRPAFDLQRLRDDLKAIGDDGLAERGASK